MKSRLLALIAILTTTLSAKAELEKGLGFSFGSPALLGARVFWRAPESPWSQQLELSKQVLKHNRSNGELTMVRFDVQYQLSQWSKVQSFAFSGASYFDGFFNSASARTSLLAIDAGVGFSAPIGSRWAMSGEFGFTLPTKGDPGFVYYGLISNLGLRWYFSSSKASETSSQAD